MNDLYHNNWAIKINNVGVLCRCGPEVVFLIVISILAIASVLYRESSGRWEVPLYIYICTMRQ